MVAMSSLASAISPTGELTTSLLPSALTVGCGTPTPARSARRRSSGQRERSLSIACTVRATELASVCITSNTPTSTRGMVGVRSSNSASRSTTCAVCSLEPITSTLPEAGSATISSGRRVRTMVCSAMRETAAASVTASARIGVNVTSSRSSCSAG